LADTCDEFLVTPDGLILSLRTGEPVKFLKAPQAYAYFEMQSSNQVDQLKQKPGYFTQSSDSEPAYGDAEEVASLTNVSL